MSVARRMPSRIGIITLRSTTASDCSSFSSAQRLVACSGVSGAPRCAGSDPADAMMRVTRATTKRRGLAMAQILDQIGRSRHPRHPPPLAPCSGEKRREALEAPEAPEALAAPEAPYVVSCPPGRASMLQEFKAFIARGNVIDLAVAVIIGAAFGKIVTTLVEGVIMPPIGMALGKADFSNLFIDLDHSKGTPE